MAEGSLADFIESVSGDSRLAVEENLGGGFVRLRTAEAERRQAKHDIRCVEDIVIEMLRNARDAGARNIYLAVAREGDEKTLVFVDDGAGVPDGMRSLIFEPRVTSKLETMVMDKWGVHGRGMALYSIAQNAEEAGVVASGEGLGSAFRVRVDLNALGEKKDQSTYPKLERGADGALAVARGPHNVVRCVVEFALEHEGKVNVYFGSPTEVAAALVEHGGVAITDDQRRFGGEDNLPVWLRPAAATDFSTLMRACYSLGLPISERTAHRIMAGQAQTAQAPLEQLAGALEPTRGKQVDIYRDSRGLKISKEDQLLFGRALSDAFDSIAQRYFIQLTDDPKIHVGKDSITVRFDIEKEL